MNNVRNTWLAYVARDTGCSSWYWYSYSSTTRLHFWRLELRLELGPWVIETSSENACRSLNITLRHCISNKEIYASYEFCIIIYNYCLRIGDAEGRRYCLSLFVPVRMSVRTKKTQKQLIINLRNFVICVMVNARSDHILIITFDLESLLSYFWLKKLPTAHILMQFYVVMYRSWYYDKFVSCKQRAYLLPRTQCNCVRVSIR